MNTKIILPSDMNFQKEKHTENINNIYLNNININLNSN